MIYFKETRETFEIIKLVNKVSKYMRTFKRNENIKKDIEDHQGEMGFVVKVKRYRLGTSRVLKIIR